MVDIEGFSPTQLRAIDLSRSSHVDRLERENASLRVANDALQKRASDLSLRLRGAPAPTVKS